MAYPTVDAPYGFRPINLIGGQVFAGSTRLIPIASGTTTSIFYGDVVRLNATGTLSRVTTTSAATDTVGIFLGCQYTNPTTKQPTYAQYYAATISASDIQGVVADDPDALFKVAVVSGAGATGSSISGLTRAAVGQNVAITQPATGGSSTSGNSYQGAFVTTSSATAPLRIVDVVPETVNASGSYTEVIVKFNFGFHTYYNATGTTTSA